MSDEENLLNGNPKEIIDELEEILKEEEIYKVHDVLESDTKSLQDNPKEMYKTIADDLTLHFGEGIQSLLLNTLITKSLGPFQDQYSEGLKEFLNDLIRRYGTPVRHGYQKLFETQDWRYITSSVRSNYRGVRLVTEVLKWSGERVVFGGTLEAMINFTQHIVKNINLNCDSNQIEENSEQITHQLESLKDQISTLEETLESEK